jgi:hypothetical protein
MAETEDLMRKIQGLLAKAEATSFEGERQAFMDKANELMNKYRIELWQIQQLQSGRISEREPIIRDFDYKFAFESGPFPDISDALWWMFLSSVRFSNCVAVLHKQHYSGEKRQYDSYKIPIIGTESDLGYLQLLFSSLMTQLMGAIYPTVNKDISYEENLRKFREAGWGWHEVAEKMRAAGYDTEMSYDAAYKKMIRAYRGYVKAMGIPQNYAHFKTFRRNFARVSARMAEMRGHEEAAGAIGEGLAIALRDQLLVNRDFANEQFPAEASKGNRQAVAVRTRKHDSAAYGAGQSAGSKANISGRSERGVGGNKKGLEK